MLNQGPREAETEVVVEVARSVAEAAGCARILLEAVPRSATLHSISSRILILSSVVFAVGIGLGKAARPFADVARHILDMRGTLAVGIATDRRGRIDVALGGIAARFVEGIPPGIDT